tara:strand:+ start:767 stop:970 length:204 start_codon:yes stop_codon:yes gene_type:complete
MFELLVLYFFPDVCPKKITGNSRRKIKHLFAFIVVKKEGKRIKLEYRLNDLYSSFLGNVFCGIIVYL